MIEYLSSIRYVILQEVLPAWTGLGWHLVSKTVPDSYELGLFGFLSDLFQRTKIIIVIPSNVFYGKYG